MMSQALVLSALALAFLCAASANTGLLIVDVQKCFMPGGALPTPHGDEVTDVVVELLASSRYKVVALSLDCHPKGHVSFASVHNKAYDRQHQPHSRLAYTPTGYLCNARHLGYSPDHAVHCAEADVLSAFELLDADSGTHPQGHQAGLQGPARLIPVHQELWPDHCVVGSEGAQLHPRLRDLLHACDGSEMLAHLCSAEHITQTPQQQATHTAQDDTCEWAESPAMHRTSINSTRRHIRQYTKRQCMPAASCSQQPGTGDGATQQVTASLPQHAPSSRLLRLCLKSPPGQDEGSSVSLTVSGSQKGASQVTEALVVLKGTEPHMDAYSPFFDSGHASSGLHEALSERGVDSLHIVGLAADVCVTQTCLDARRLGYAVTLLVNATRPVSAEHMGQTLNRLRDAGVRVVEGAGGESEDERQEAAVQ